MGAGGGLWLRKQGAGGGGEGKESGRVLGIG